MAWKKGSAGWLFAVNAGVSAFTFGGGYTVLPLLRRAYAERNALLREDELFDLAALAQTSPGAIAVNFAALCGLRIGGWRGAAAAVAGALLPPVAVLSAAAWLYAGAAGQGAVAAVLRGMTVGAAALLLDYTVDLWRAARRGGRLWEPCLMAAAFAAVFGGRVHVAWVLGAGALLAMVRARITAGRDDAEPR